MVEIIISIVKSVVAELVVSCICKWLDRKDRQ